MSTAKDSAQRIAELLEAAFDEDAAVGALDRSVARLRRARAAQAALAQLDTVDLRAELELSAVLDPRAVLEVCATDLTGGAR